MGGGWQDVTQRWAKTLQEGDSDADPTTDQNRQALQVLFVVLNAILRDALRLGAAARIAPVLADSAKSLDELANWPGQGLVGAIKQVTWAESAIARNANTVLTLEALAVKLAQCSRGVMAGSASSAAREPTA